ncbi:MAG: single-stranded DNA-binding protein [Pseudomonadota bacterium]
MNRVTLFGNLGADPEVKSFQDGGRLATLSLATSEKWRDKQTSEIRERVEWHRVVIKADGLVGVVQKYARKGSKLLIEGQIQTRKWQDQNGQDRYATEIVVAGFNGRLWLAGDPRGGDQGTGGGGQGVPAGAGAGGGAGGAARGPDLDDEIPF